MQECDGERTTAQIAAALAAQGLPFGPAAVEAFAAKLRQLGLVERSLAERSVLLMERVRAERRRRLRSPHADSSLLRMRWALADPDQWLERWLPRLRVCFSRPFLVASVGLFAVYAFVAWTQWPDLAHALATLTRPSSYTLEMFLVFWTTGMVVIVVHELGHAFTCKYFGGQVHEMGAMLIYFQPAFYCNVNDAWTFRDRAARLWVTAAGSWIQLVVPGLRHLRDAGVLVLHRDPHPGRRCRVWVGEPGARRGRRPGLCARTLGRAPEQAAGVGPGARHVAPRTPGAVAIATLLVSGGRSGGPGGRRRPPRPMADHRAGRIHGATVARAGGVRARGRRARAGVRHGGRAGAPGCAARPD